MTKLISRLLLNNQHRVSSLMSPDGKLSQHKIDQEKAKPSSIKSTLTEDQKQEIIATAEALKQRAKTRSMTLKFYLRSILMTFHLLDPPDFSTSKATGTQISSYPQATNGLYIKKSLPRYQCSMRVKIICDRFTIMS